MRAWGRSVREKFGLCAKSIDVRHRMMRMRRRRRSVQRSVHKRPPMALARARRRCRVEWDAMGKFAMFMATSPPGGGRALSTDVLCGTHEFLLGVGIASAARTARRSRRRGWSRIEGLSVRRHSWSRACVGVCAFEEWGLREGLFELLHVEFVGCLRWELVFSRSACYL